MKTAKLTNITTDEAGLVAQRLGARRVLYRDAPMLNASQIADVVAEFKLGECDAIIFDKGAIFDVPAYDIAREAVAQVYSLTHTPKGLRKHNYLPELKVVIYNKP